MSSHTLHHGDCLAVLRSMEADSVDAIVTDPPAGIAFMGKEWDKDKGGRDAWVKWMTEVARECFRVIKPGGHALVWAIPRTSHWTGWAWEDGGWEPRDKIVHLFGSGFPKSLSVSKALDKAAGAEREVVGSVKLPKFDKNRGHGRDGDGAVIHVGMSRKLGEFDHEITAPATDAAKQWDGWGTALKPAAEDWWLFRKPLVGTVAANVVRHGTGALNIDATRIASDGEHMRHGTVTKQTSVSGDDRSALAAGMYAAGASFTPTNHAGGRWPPNTVLVHTPDCRQTGTRTVKAPVINRFTDGMKPFGDGAGHPYESVGGGDEEIPVWECSDGCPVKALDEQNGSSSSSIRSGGEGEHLDPSREGWRFKRAEGGFNDAGGASRFFPQFSYTAEEAPFRYMAKAGRSERDEGVVGTPAKQMDESRDPDAPGANNPRNRGGRVASNFHPTVKPIALMRWLARLVTQPDGTILDPFMGSGTTGCAAMYEGFNFIGIEQSDEYLEIARQRIEYHSLKARGGVVSPWENPAPVPSAEKPEAKSDPASLEDLFGFGE